jgi:hypothetical protein
LDVGQKKNVVPRTTGMFRIERKAMMPFLLWRRLRRIFVQEKISFLYKGQIVCGTKRLGGKFMEVA